MSNILKNKQAFSLIEVIVALGLFAILAAGVFNITTSSYKNFYGTGDKQSLTEYAQEGVEAVRSIRDNSWQSIEDVSETGDKGLTKDSNGYWDFSGTSDSLGVLTRKVSIEDVSRDDEGEIVTSGGTNDPNTKKLTVTISGSGISDYVLTSYLSNWSYRTWEQTDWSASSASEFWSGFTQASSSFSNVNTSTPTGTLKLSGSYDASGYLYSSIFSVWSGDKELQSIAVEQDVPSACNLDITIEGANSINFNTGIVSEVFSDDSTTYYVSSTPKSLNGKEFIRYKVDLAACNGNSETPTLYSVKINYR